MGFVTRWMGWEALFIHGLTGLLFAGVSVFLVYRLAVSEPLVLALVLPFTAFCAWGWWAEAVVLRRATAWMRSSTSRRDGSHRT
ncbi:MAG TPA: hypothetical protein VNN10_04345 [Dehalococcoidia bacterium]|nr:hypothetical protein [Dehalococcoidia bacterium]